VLDTETTGLDPFSGHRVVEIGCVEMLHGMRTGNTFHVYLNPERDMPDEAYRVHGISGEFLKDKPVFAEKVDEFLEFLADSQLVIHNAGFDMKFINWELERLGFKAIPMSRATDTVQIARKKFPGSPASLDALCKRFEIDLSARTKHGALLDAELLSDVYVELMGGRQVTLALDALAPPPLPASETTIHVAAEVLPSREFPVPAEELAAHREFVASLKNPIWLEIKDV
ncbi:MAG: DNA polymerase III subunit epsilon, partial [Proteobacteria bacterium]|nr:DNA polymerase III subunit epsilon [Pseudomonadota bacterium]